MTGDTKFKFYIDAYSPEDMPMAKLAQYMADFAELLGKDHAVHFLTLERGSTTIVSRVEREDVPKVTGRLLEIRSGSASKETLKLVAEIDNRLANDNAIGRILEEGRDGSTAELIAFAGRNRPKPAVYGPFTQEGHLDGILISVGGKDETVPVRLLNGETIYSNCDTTRTIARDLGHHLFEPVRVHGAGRWRREADGQWTLIRFRIHGFIVLDKGTLRDAVAALRAVPGSRWDELDEPLAELRKIQGKDDLH
jgi:hypothetical protein